MTLPIVVDIEWLRNRCEMVPEAGCWIWMGHTNSEGYGRFHKRGQPCVAVHRLSYAIANGIPILTIPRTLCVRHTCDTPSCANPDHLLLGTWKENVHDAKQRGRHAVAFREVDGKVVGPCANGHDLSVTGVYDYGIQSSGYRLRVCLECKRTAAREHMRRKAQEIGFHERAAAAMRERRQRARGIA